MLALIYGAATIDIRRHDDQPLRNVSLNHIDVGGHSAEQLDAELDRLSELVETAPVYIETPDAAYEINAERLGLTIDRPATRAAVLRAGREGSTVVRPFGWFGSLFSPRRVDAVLRLDAGAAEDGLAAVSRTISVPPGDPTLMLINGRLELEPGSPGSILDVSRLVRDLSMSLPAEPGEAISVEAFTTSDSIIDREIQALVDRLNGSSTEPIELLVNGTRVLVQPADFRSWVRLNQLTDPPTAFLDVEALHPFLNERLGIAQSEINTRELVVNGDRITVPPANAAVCCDPSAATTILDGVLNGTSPIVIDLVSDARQPLIDLGVAELIGEFTTRHAAGQDRVVNIQRMADIVRGAVIEPGATFSLNEWVGPRTTAKGFVSAGVIYDGVFTDDVGGGVSQFATTMFNASFFGGLDLVDYQAHSIYFERYPYGREATISWPDVDLAVRNPTDTPVLVWTEYTPGSITVKLFGTRTAIGEQTAQETAPVGECTRVRTERTRRWLDGRVDTDVVWATYQPNEGIGCDGQPTIPPPECADGEVLVDTTGNGFGDACAPDDRICPPETVPTDSDNDGDIDFCDVIIGGECPPETTATDTDGDGEIDRCITGPAPDPDDVAVPDPNATPDPDATAPPAPTPEPTATPEPTVTPVPTATPEST